MKHLKKEIEAQKRAIGTEKHKMEDELHHLKEQLATPAALAFSLIGGFIAGTLFLPRKTRLTKLLMKSYSLTTTVQQIANLVRHLKK